MDPKQLYWARKGGRDHVRIKAVQLAADAIKVTGQFICNLWIASSRVEDRPAVKHKCFLFRAVSLGILEENCTGIAPKEFPTLMVPVLLGSLPGQFPDLFTSILSTSPENDMLPARLEIRNYLHFISFLCIGISQCTYSLTYMNEGLGFCTDLIMERNEWKRRKDIDVIVSI